MSESIERFIGIDVSKGSLDVLADPPSQLLPRHCGYDDAALKVLCDAVAHLAPTLVVMEASGGLERRAATELASRGVRLAVVNPRQVRNFARASGELAKTDAASCAPSPVQSGQLRALPRTPTRPSWPSCCPGVASWSTSGCKNFNANIPPARA